MDLAVRITFENIAKITRAVGANFTNVAKFSNIASIMLVVLSCCVQTGRAENLA